MIFTPGGSFDICHPPSLIRAGAKSSLLLLSHESRYPFLSIKTSSFAKATSILKKDLIGLVTSMRQRKNNRFPYSTKNSNTVKPVSSGYPH